MSEMYISHPQLYTTHQLPSFHLSTHMAHITIIAPAQVIYIPHVEAIMEYIEKHKTTSYYYQLLSIIKIPYDSLFNKILHGSSSWEMRQPEEKLNFKTEN